MKQELSAEPSVAFDRTFPLDARLAGVYETVRESATAGRYWSSWASSRWLTGQAFLFPSLGPTEFLLSTRPTAGASRPRRVLGGHVLGALAGLATYHALAAGLVITTAHAPLSTASVFLALSGTLSVVLTTAAMVATGLRHAPACATTLIVSLELLSSPTEGLIIGLSVVGLLAAHRALVAADVAPAKTVADHPS